MEIVMEAALDAVKQKALATGEDHKTVLKFKTAPLIRDEAVVVMASLLSMETETIDNFLEENENPELKISAGIGYRGKAIFHPLQRTARVDPNSDQEYFTEDDQALTFEMFLRKVNITKKYLPRQEDHGFIFDIEMEKDVDPRLDGEISYYLRRKEGQQIKYYNLEILERDNAQEEMDD